MRAQENAIADAGGGAAFSAAVEDDADFRRAAICGAVPLGGLGDQVAIIVAAGDFGEHDIGEMAGGGETAAAMIDFAFFAQRAQSGAQLGLAGRVEAKGTRDLAFGNAAAALFDEGNEFVAVRGRGFFRFFGLILH
jgi:hypothetical protein